MWLFRMKSRWGRRRAAPTGDGGASGKGTMPTHLEGGSALSPRAATSPRTLAVFGVTGLTGQALARIALARGWAVRGFARSESRAPAASVGLTVVRGDFSDPERVAEVVAGAEAACCVLGPRAPYTEAFCAPATRTIIQAMREVGPRRLVCQTGAMVGSGNRTLAFEWLARTFARRNPAAAGDRVEQERLVQGSGLDWTIVKPPRLTNGPAGRGLSAGPALRVGLLSSVSRAAVATFMLDIIDTAQYSGARVFVRG